MPLAQYLYHSPPPPPIFLSNIDLFPLVSNKKLREEETRGLWNGFTGAEDTKRGQEETMQDQKHCVVCGKAGANWVVEWDGVRHPVHNQSAPEAERCSCQLASWAPPDAILRLFASPELRSSKRAERVLNRVKEARRSGRRTVKDVAQR